MRIHLLLIVTMLMRLFLQPVCTCDSMENPTETHQQTSAAHSTEPSHKCGKHQHTTPQDPKPLHSEKPDTPTQSPDPFEHQDDCPIKQVDDSLAATLAVSQNNFLLIVLAVIDLPTPETTEKPSAFAKSQIQIIPFWSVPTYLRLLTLVI